MIMKKLMAAVLAAVTVFTCAAPEVTAQAATITDWSSYSSSYFYNQMSTNEKRLYSNMTAAAQKVMDSSDNYSRVTAKFTSLTLDQVTDVLKVWTQTEAQYFFVASQYGYSYSGYGESGVHSGDAYVTVMSEYQGGSARQRAKKTFENTIQSLLSQASAGSTIIDKEKIIHDALAKRLTWDGSDQYSKQSSASSLIGDTTVCAGYSAAFSVLMNALGAPTVSITSSSHEWNEIYLGGRWYNVDVTYDDPLMNGGSNTFPDGSNIQYTYFNVSDQTLRRGNSAHTPDAVWGTFNRPVCSVDGGQNISVSGDTKPDFENVAVPDYIVSVSPRSVTLKRKKSKTISVKTNDPATVKWSSGNKRIATVSSRGRITGRKRGSTTVKATVTFADGTKKTVRVNVKIK